MKGKMRFVWIDDSIQRSRSAELMEKHLRINVDFKHVKNNNLPDLISVLIKEKEPDLIIMDHNLQHAGIFTRGSTVAQLIRDTWPKCPIISITAVDIDQIDSRMRSVYEEMFSINNISNHYKTIIELAKEYRKLRKNAPQKLITIINKFNPPKIDKEKLIAVLPTELKDNFSDKSLIINLSKWTRRVLLSRPGFLYNKLTAATYLGLNESGFDKIEKLFDDASYKGIFAKTIPQLWWKSSLTYILFANVKSTNSIIPWEVGRMLNKITKRDYSKCYVSGEEYPETVAYIDLNSNEEKPMKLKYTIPHPNFEELLFFDEIRMMKD
jgi:CheY-like chemotaxis protein